jgi:aconitate hydratase
MFKDPYQIQKLLNTKNNTFTYYSLTELEKQGHGNGISKLPFSIPILLENALRILTILRERLMKKQSN